MRQCQVARLYKDCPCLQPPLLSQLNLWMSGTHPWPSVHKKKASVQIKRPRTQTQCPLAVGHLKDSWKTPFVVWALLESRNNFCHQVALRRMKETENFLIARPDPSTIPLSLFQFPFSPGGLEAPGRITVIYKVLMEYCWSFGRKWVWGLPHGGSSPEVSRELGTINKNLSQWAIRMGTLSPSLHAALSPISSVLWEMLPQNLLGLGKHWPGWVVWEVPLAR